MRQDKKGRLKNVLRIFRLRQYTTPDAPDQTAVPGDQRGKGAAVAIKRPAAEKLAIRIAPAASGIGQVKNLVHENICGAGHGRDP